jgi:hypothetical protein
MTLLPTLLQEPGDLVDTLFGLLALPIHHVGLGIPDPVTLAQTCHKTSVQCTVHQHPDRVPPNPEVPECACGAVSAPLAPTV